MNKADRRMKVKRENILKIPGSVLYFISAEHTPSHYIFML